MTRRSGVVLAAATVAAMAREATSKPSNPKQAFADKKTPVAIGSGSTELWDCLGLLEGALKYGRSNYRVMGVRVSTYIDAARRHLLKFAEGEFCAPDTQVPHLVSVRACVGIILDAWTASTFPRTTAPTKVGGKFLTDDRIPSVDIEAVERETARISNHLREMFKDHNPRHMTIDDTNVVELDQPVNEVPADGTHMRTIVPAGTRYSKPRAVKKRQKKAAKRAGR